MKNYENFIKKKSQYYILLECITEDDHLGEYAIFQGEKNENNSYYGHFIRNKEMIEAHYNTYLYPETDMNGETIYEDDLTLEWRFLDINMKFETILNQYNRLTIPKDFNL